MTREMALGVLLACGLVSTAQGVDLLDSRISAGKVTTGKVKKATITNTQAAANCKNGWTITEGDISKGDVSSGTVSGGKVPSSMNVDKEKGTATFDLENTSLSNAEIKGATIAKAKCQDSAGATKNEDSSITADIKDASIQAGTITGAQVPESAIVNRKPVLSQEDSSVSFAGDYMRFYVQVPGFVPLGGTETAAITAPANSCFRVDNDPAKDQGAGKISGKFIAKDEWSGLNLLKGLILMNCEIVPNTDVRYANAPKTNVQYTVDKASMTTYDRERSGWTYGVLLTPFKYYPGQKHFGSNTSIGGYLGYRVHDRQGVSDVLAFSAGPTTAAVSTASGTTNETGATLAIAWLSEIKNSFIVGFIIGRDYFSATSNFQYKGATWIGINFGLKAN